MEQLLTCATEILGRGTRVVSIRGEIDLYTSTHLERELQGALGGANIVVDLAECSLIDATGLGILLATNERLGGSEARLAVVTDDNHIRKVFEVTGLDTVFALHPTRAAALEEGVRV